MIFKAGDTNNSFNAANFEIAELQIKPKQKSGQTKNLERLYNCLVSFFLSCFLVRHAQNSSDVTLAFEDAD